MCIYTYIHIYTHNNIPACAGQHPRVPQHVESLLLRRLQPRRSQQPLPQAPRRRRLPLSSYACHLFQWRVPFIAFAHYLKSPLGLDFMQTRLQHISFYSSIRLPANQCKLFGSPKTCQQQPKRLRLTEALESQETNNT